MWEMKISNKWLAEKKKTGQNQDVNVLKWFCRQAVYLYPANGPKAF